MARPVGPVGAAFVAALYLALILAIAFLALDFRPYLSPSAAMAPALREGDRFFAAKHPYGFSRFSFPFGLLRFDGRYFAQSPSPGEIAVFVSPSDDATLQVFRVVGLPGDTVQFLSGHLHLNGRPIAREEVDPQAREDRMPTDAKFYRETLPNGVSYVTIDSVDNGYGDETSAVIVPDGHFFVLGDNRDNANDSRFGIGPVPLDRLIARAQFIYWNGLGKSVTGRRNLRAIAVQ